MERPPIRLVYGKKCHAAFVNVTSKKSAVTDFLTLSEIGSNWEGRCSDLV